MTPYLKRRRQQALWQEYRKRQPRWRYFQDVKNEQHGNFHFHDDGLITLRKQGNLLLELCGLERLYYLSAIQSIEEQKGGNYCWRKFNRGIQEIIDAKLAELEPLIEQLELERPLWSSEFLVKREKNWFKRQRDIL
ncbi:MAG TPA: hypothetical protein VFB60_24495 [Ktedonobacteraceae bacterium]|nr:hypothetical protein [Ktedonobacteraceae bacterium]